MPSSKKAKDTKKKTKVDKRISSCKEDCVAFLVILGFLAVMGGIFYWLYEPDYEPKFQTYNCALNRIGETVVVRNVYNYIEEYTIQKGKYLSTDDGWMVVPDYGTSTYDKDIKWMDENYVKVPCRR